MQEDRLRRRLSKLKMDMNVVRGDGNCLVRSLPFQAYLGPHPLLEMLHNTGKRQAGCRLTNV